MTSLTQARLKELLHYDPLTGVFTRLVARSGHEIGEIAGSPARTGHRQIVVDGHHYALHRLAWFYMTGKWPKHQIDHKDTIKNNNVWTNLREATNGQNKCNSKKYANNTSGFKGVTRSKSGGKPWQAQIQSDKVNNYLGRFDTPEEAHAAYCEAAAIHHKEFARTA